MTAPKLPPSHDGEHFAAGRGQQAAAYMLSGMVMGALMGLGLRWLTNQGWTVIVGLLAGLALSWYTIWVRYVRPTQNDAADEEKR